MYDFYANISTEILRDYLVFLASVFTLLMFFVTYLIFKNYITTKHVESQIKRFNLHEDSVNTISRKLYSAENKLLKYGLLDPRLQSLERILDAYAVTVTDANGIITYANDSFCELSGHTREELIGKPHGITSSGEHTSEFWKDMWDQIKSGKVWHSEIINRNKNGKLYWLDTIIIPLSLITEKDIGYISLRTDITPLRERNQALAKSIREKEQKLNAVEGILIQSEKMASMGMLAAGVAHEINNPIAYISSNVLKLREYIDAMSPIINTSLSIAGDPEMPESIRQRITACAPNSKEVDFLLEDSSSVISETIDGIARVKKIVSDLKSFTHNGNSKKIPTDINRCIESALNLANNEIKYKGRVIRNLEEIPLVECVEPQINQVILNLVVNAAHAIEKNGEITVSSRLLGDDQISISIADNGCGMPPEVLDRIFEPFFTTKPVGKGTGIGLAISNDIILKHQGNIAVASKTGEGTTFTIVLPIRQQSSEKSLP